MSELSKYPATGPSIRFAAHAARVRLDPLQAGTAPGA